MKSFHETITASMSLDTLLSLPEFLPIRQQLLTDDFFDLTKLGDVPLRDLSNTWNLPLLCLGLNRVLKLRRAGEPVLYWYGPEPHQFLFRFPGKPGAKTVVICPGGGYSLVWSPGEGYPVAARLNQMGYNAFVVNYRVGDQAEAPNPMDDLAAAIRYLHDHSAALQSDLTGYAVMGFSAGGHLAASFGTESLGWRHYDLPRPGAMMLCYPVVTMGPSSEPTSRSRLLGCRLGDAAAEAAYSVERQVTPAYPPSFLWQCDHDAVVPIENTILLDRALTNHHIVHSYETYSGQDHGTGLADGTAAAGWLERAISFWERVSPAP